MRKPETIDKYDRPKSTRAIFVNYSGKCKSENLSPLSCNSNRPILTTKVELYRIIYLIYPKFYYKLRKNVIYTLQLTYQKILYSAEGFIRL